jgi:prefoldin subunit 5
LTEGLRKEIETLKMEIDKKDQKIAHLEMELHQVIENA